MMNTIDSQGKDPIKAREATSPSEQIPIKMVAPARSSSPSPYFVSPPWPTHSTGSMPKYLKAIELLMGFLSWAERQLLVG